MHKARCLDKLLSQLFLHITLNFANPSNFINYGTLTSALSAKSGGIMNRAGVWMVSGSANQHVSLVNLPNGKMEIDFTMVESSTAVTTAYQRYPIQKEYELNDHLSNVMVVVSGKTNGVDTDNNGKADYYSANVVSANFYYPFGAELPGRKYTLSNYRYGFNGKTKDDEGLGGGSSTYDYGFRIYNPALGKFLSVDPLASSYAWYSPYHFAGNNPIVFNDLDGREPNQAIFYIKHPIAASKIEKNSDIAFKVAEQAKLPNIQDGKQDAFRHAFWMALNAQDKEVGYDLAVEFSKAHEDDGIREMVETGQDPDLKAVKMDNHNNAIGARIGLNNPKATKEELAGLIKSSIDKGELLIVYMDKTGNYIDKDGYIINPLDKNYQKQKTLVSSNTELPKEGKKLEKLNIWEMTMSEFFPKKYENRAKEKTSEKKANTPSK